MADAARLRDAGNLAASIEPLRQAARLQPDSATIQHDLGLSYLHCGRLAEAVAALRTGILRKPHIAHAHWRLGLALERLEDWPGATAAYREAVTQLPSLTDARYRLACLLESQGHRRDAIQQYRAVASAAARTGLGRLAAARVLLAEECDAEAENALRQCLALEPANALAHDMLGTVLADAGRFGEAAGYSSGRFRSMQASAGAGTTTLDAAS